jgi:lysine 2,3-aminomutase
MEAMLLPQDESEPPGTIALTQQQIKKAILRKPSQRIQNKKSSPTVYGGIVNGSLDLKPKSLQPIDPRVKEFREKYYAEVTDAEWHNWRWQLRHRIRSFSELGRLIDLSPDEYSADAFNTSTMPLAITPYYAGLLDPAYNSDQALRKAVIPLSDEYLRSPGEEEDPLGEDSDSPVPGLVHRYPDRVLFLVTDFCSVNCRYCTRSRIIRPNEKYPFNMRQWEQAIEYIRNHPEVRDVLLSGGDPLTLADEKLEWLLKSLREIPHVEFLRIGTKEIGRAHV